MCQRKHCRLACWISQEFLQHLFLSRLCCHHSNNSLVSQELNYLKYLQSAHGKYLSWHQTQNTLVYLREYWNMAYFHWHCITDHCPDMRWQVVTPWIAMVSSAQCLVSHWLEHDQGQELTGMTLVLTLATLHAIHWPLEAAGHHTTTHMISLQYRPADRVAMQPAGVVSPLVTLLRCCSAHGHYWHCSSLPERVARWPGQTAQQHSHSTVLPDNTTICGTHSGTWRNQRVEPVYI